MLSSDKTPIIELSAIVLPKITTYTASGPVDLSKFFHLQILKFADDVNSNSEIHILLGANAYAVMVLGDMRKGKANEPIAQNTIFGSIVFGSFEESHSQECVETARVFYVMIHTS